MKANFASHLLICLFLSYIFCFPVYSQEINKKIPTASIDVYHNDTKKFVNEILNVVTITIDGAPLDSDVPGFLSDGRTMIPVKVISEKLGATVTWSEEDQQATIVSKDKTIILTIGSQNAMVNGKSEALYDGIPANLAKHKNIQRTVVPVRFVSEQLGYNIAWDSKTYTANIQTTSAGKDDTPSPPTQTAPPIPTEPEDTISPPAANLAPYVSIETVTNETVDNYPSITLTSLEDFQYIAKYQPSNGASNDVFTIAIPNAALASAIDIEGTPPSDQGIKSYIASDFIDGNKINVNLVVNLSKSMAYKLTYTKATHTLKISFAPLGTSGFTTPPTFVSSKYNDITIAIDAGHGGNDSGAASGKLYEKDLNLDVALRLQKNLESKGFTVLMIRETDIKVENYLRTYFANAMKVDLFLSIHHNSSTSAAPSGLQAICDGVDTSNPLNIEKLKFGNLVLNTLVSELNMKNTGLINKSTYIVTRETNMVSALAELGFISNENDRALMATEAQRQKCADALSKAIINYFN